MEKIIAAIILVIFILFAVNKNYREILIFLIICFILDWIVVKVFSTIPLTARIVTFVGKPMLSLLTYAIIEFISMEVFYYILRKYNYIKAIIVYLVIHLIINICYITISKNIILDLVFNFIIGNIIIMAYKKSVVMEDIKWFAIIGGIIDTISTFLISKIFLLGIGIILLLGAIFMPVIICVAVPGLIGTMLTAIIIWLTRKRLSEKSKTFKIVIYVIILIFCECITLTAGSLVFVYESHKPDKLYIEMKKINEKQSLIGVSKEQVVELLGKPIEEYNSREDKVVYCYNAGKISNSFFSRESEYYELRVVFNENDKVESTSIIEDLKLGG